MAGTKLRFGALIASFHPLRENSTQAIERDLELVCHMDRLGFDEAWIGEHHSAGYELIARYVAPRFQQANDNRAASLDWARDNRPRFIGEAQKAVGARVAQHIEEKGAGNIRPEILAAMGLDKTEAAE